MWWLQKELLPSYIDSSHCINCPNNHHLALLIFFSVAGILFVLVIAGLNLTVTNGTINGLIFFANIIWAYQSILFPNGPDKQLIVHKIFIAWLNLDFGIKTCFFHGMNAYSKVWLQFIFPFYTASLFVLGLYIILQNYILFLEVVLLQLWQRCYSCPIRSFLVLSLHAFNWLHTTLTVIQVLMDTLDNGHNRDHCDRTC